MGAVSTSVARTDAVSLDTERVRRDFPALHQQVRGKPFVYLDSAASALKPQPVIDAVSQFYTRDGANIHRGVYQMAQRATEAYEGAREKVRAFVGARTTKEIIFVRGTTEAINLVAHSWGRTFLKAGDEILLTTLEHHSNIVPWQMLRDLVGVRLVVVPLQPNGDVRFEDIEGRVTSRTRLITMAHVSNALGTVLPVEKVAALARSRGITTLFDGAQAAPHMAIDVQAFGSDFYCFSGHKTYGPTGVGVLWGREELLEAMPPYQGGGDMIRSVTFERTLYATLPSKFEAGTPDIAGVIGLGAAVDYLQARGLAAVARAEEDLRAYATRALEQIPGLRIVGTAPRKIGVLSFVLGGVHPHDIGTIVDSEGVAIRTGHHCAQPLMEALGLGATARATLGIYNTRADIDALVRALLRVKELFHG